jgi:ribosome-associated protein
MRKEAELTKKAPATSAAVIAATAPKSEHGFLLDLLLGALEDGKAENIVSIDLKGRTAIGDAMVIASGRSNRHVGALADQLIHKLKDAGCGNPRVEGVPQCDWVLIDTGDVIVHIFRPEVREFYNLEKMWSSERPNPVEPV